MRAFLLIFSIVSLTASALHAEDITTLSGKTFTGVSDVKAKPDGLTFITATGPVTVKFTDLPQAVRDQYGYDPFAAAVFTAHRNKPQKLALTDAFSLSNLEQAKTKAAAEGKLLGFVMVWDQFFGVVAAPLAKTGGSAGLVHFYQVFNPTLVLVFVRHEAELGLVPDAVKKGFAGPDEGGFAPNLCVTDSTATEYICEIPLGGGKDSDGPKREAVFKAKIEVIKTFLAAHPLTPTATEKISENPVPSKDPAPTPVPAETPAR